MERFRAKLIKILLFQCVVFFTLSFVIAGESWIRFNLIERPYYDRDGNILPSIEGRRNRPGIDEFTGGGKVYPDLGKVKIIERHEKDQDLLLLVDGDTTDLKKKGSVTYQASPKTLKTEPLGFEPRVIADTEAEDMKATVFGIVKSVESGVTG